MPRRRAKPRSARVRSGVLRGGEEGLEVFADDLVEHGAGRVAGCVPQRCHGRAARAARNGFAGHAPEEWQWPMGAASLRVADGLAGSSGDRFDEAQEWHAEADYH
jgi:hypothetical protein